jgi:hypothetical protein
MKTVKVDEWFHEYLKTEKRGDETMGEDTSSVDDVRRKIADDS